MKSTPLLISPLSPLPQGFSPSLVTLPCGRQLEVQTAECFLKMQRCALSDGVSLKLLSGYRSIDYQKMLFDKSLNERLAAGMPYHSAYTDTARNVALPGTSEHNAGLACDIVRESDDDVYEEFENTREFDWLIKNAYRFGFILRYPDNKTHITGYIYEPWHFRYVGKYHARRIFKRQICLEEYVDLYRFYAK